MLGFTINLPSSSSEYKANQIYTKDLGGESQICYTDENKKVNFLRNPEKIKKSLKCSEIYKFLQSRLYNIPGLFVLENEMIDRSFIQYKSNVTYEDGDKCYIFKGIYVYVSLQNNNKGHTPNVVGNTQYWRQLSESEISLLPINFQYSYVTSYQFKTDYEYSEGKTYSSGSYCYIGSPAFYIFKSLVDRNSGNYPGLTASSNYWAKDGLIDGLCFLGGYEKNKTVTRYEFDPYNEIPICDVNDFNRVNNPLISVHDYDMKELYETEMTEVYGYSTVPPASDILDNLSNEYDTKFGSMSVAEMYNEVSLCESYQKRIDLLNCLTSVELIKINSGKYTNSISVKDWKYKILDYEGISCRIDMNMSYTKFGEIYSRDLAFTAFRTIKDENNNYIFQDSDSIYSINDDIEVEYVGDLITVRPKINAVTECIITNCILTYGKL